ncbi:MAG TPA: hypothetical protein DIT07_13465 [Sphingobacteriaceae bacterium]|nr:hypothetical protein [Sphingobacteriaceae bacterium]
MEQINYSEEYRRLFLAYRSNSLRQDGNDLQLISDLIDKFPYCQSLYFIHAACIKSNPEKLEGSLFKAALRTANPETLYQTIHHPDKLIVNATLVPEVKKEAKAEDIRQPVSEFLVESENSTDEIDFETLTDDSIVFESSPDVEDEDLIEDSFAPGEHFAFNKSESLPQKDPDTDQTEFDTVQNGTGHHDFMDTDSQRVSKYNDDTLPYTFLWWLNKTRKEHNENYRPYVSFKLDTTRPIKRQKPDQLNQQIIENIFHLNVPFENYEKKTAFKPNTIEFEIKKKEDDIIEKFIKQDPQIRPMPAEKIDTENKAKKSAEDTYDLVSETLAQIYTEQMLFHKAIDTYKKLSLKFPEKNAYFADQISELEKRGS